MRCGRLLLNGSNWRHQNKRTGNEEEEPCQQSKELKRFEDKEPYSVCVLNHSKLIKSDTDNPENGFISSSSGRTILMLSTQTMALSTKKIVHVFFF